MDNVAASVRVQIERLQTHVAALRLERRAKLSGL